MRLGEGVVCKQRVRRTAGKWRRSSSGHLQDGMALGDLRLGQLPQRELLTIDLNQHERTQQTIGRMHSILESFTNVRCTAIFCS